MDQNSWSQQVILGVDPGTVVTGYGIIEILPTGVRVIDFGCIKPPAREKLTMRYRIIFEGIALLLEKHPITSLAVETQFIKRGLGSNVQSGMKVSMARAVALLAATLRDHAVFEYAPTRVKQAVTGRGQAPKEQVQKMVGALLGLSQLPQPEDASDALAVAICHWHSLKRDEHHAAKI